MFSKFFKPRWQHKSAYMRLEAALAMKADKAEEAVILEQLASNDDDESVRMAAISQLTGPELLLQIAHKSDGKVREKCLEQIREAICRGSLPFDTLSRQALQYPQFNLITLFFSNSTNESELTQLFSLLGPVHHYTAMQCWELALLSRNPTLRVTALENIQDLESLHLIAKQHDKLDKRSNQFIRERLRLAREQEQSLKAEHERQEKICVRLEALARSSHHPLYANELQYLEQSWSVFTNQDNVLNDRVQKAVAKCHETVNQQLASTAQTGVLAEQYDETTGADRDPSDETLKRESGSTSHESAAVEPADVSLKTVAQTEDPEVKRLREQRRAEKDKKNKELEQHLQNLITQLDLAIGERNLRKSNEHNKAIRDLLRQLDPHHAKLHLGRVQLLQAQLVELGEWQEYAVLPKMAALCDSMEELIDAEIAAPEKAVAIRQLQEQWRVMKAPASPAAQELWQRFKTASDAAYLPCAAHFAHEKEVRAFNLLQRQNICDALEEYDKQDWASVDWKSVAVIIEKAREEFRKFHPVERNDEKPIRARFDSVLNAINNRLSAELEANEQHKATLVAKAKALLDSDDLSGATEQVKHLQKEWKTIRAARRGPDQKLWREFQQHCDAVFNKRREQHESRQREQTAQFDHSLALCEQIAALAKLPDQELILTREQFNSLEQQIAELGDLSEKQRTALYKCHEEARTQYLQQLAGIAPRNKARQLDTIRQLADYCQQLELRHENADVEFIKANWSIESLPAEIGSALMQRFNNALSIHRGELLADCAAAESARRKLCVELEITTQSESPESDKSLRRDIQMQALAQGFGRAAQIVPGQKELLLLSWYAMPSADGTIQQQLQQRFEALIQKLV